MCDGLELEKHADEMHRTPAIRPNDFPMSRAPSRVPWRRRSAGLTIIELVIVLLLLGILAAAAAPQFFDSLARYRAESAARRIAHDLRLARRHAVATSMSESVTFNSPVAHAYEFATMPDPRRPGDSYIVNVSAEPYLATIVAVDFGGDGTLSFDGYGQPDSGGSVTVQSGAHQQVVHVDADSGRVTVP